MSGLGVETHLVYRGSVLLKSFDSKMSEKIQVGMKEKGITIQINILRLLNPASMRWEMFDPVQLTPAIIHPSAAEKLVTMRDKAR